MKEIASHFYAGIQALQSGEFGEAEMHFQFILDINPDHIPTLINLGALELKRGNAQIAIGYFTQVLILDENNVMARQNLAATFMHYDRFENALTHYKVLEKRGCLEVEDLYNMGVASAALGQLSDAIAYYQQVIAQENTHNAALNNLAAIYIRQGNRSLAVDFLQRALQSRPDDTSSQFMLDVLTNSQQNPAASQDYVRNLFNNYALYYEQHLKKILQYSLPEQSFKILRELNFDRFSHGLDLGCGTGLSGISLRHCCERLTGVDLSSKMLLQARSKNIYDDLIEAEIIRFLSENSTHYDLIQALDVLPYFGQLNELFDKIVPRLSKKGIFVLSAEISEDAPWKIQESMRFCHHPDYIQTLLETYFLQLLHTSKVIARQENDQNLYSSIMIYQKVDDSIL